jgi:hypothetical protein
LFESNLIFKFSKQQCRDEAEGDLQDGRTGGQNEDNLLKNERGKEAVRQLK